MPYKMRVPFFLSMHSFRDIEFPEQVPFWIVTWRGQNFNEEKLSGGNQGKEVAVTTPNLDPWLPPLNVD